VGLLFWLFAGARSVLASLFLIAASLAGGASSAVVWLVILASDF
jgi:hypothetical protein